MTAQPAPAPTARERIAAIDVGSNSVRLLVAEYDPASGLTVRDDQRKETGRARHVYSLTPQGRGAL